MGLEGVESTTRKIMENLELLTTLSLPNTDVIGNPGFDNTANMLADLHLDSTFDCMDQMQLLLQAQALLKKSEVYQNIEEALQMSYVFHPNVYNNLPQTVDQFREDVTVTCLHRDAAVNNLRFFNIFYGYRPATFALSVNLLDRLLGKVKVHPKYLSCIATSCFYIAVKTKELGKHNVFIPSATELVKLSQCGGGESDLARMESLILDKLQWQIDAVTPLAFLQLFYELFVDKDQRFAQPTMLNALIAKLEVLLCQFEFTKYRAETVALALLSHCLLELDMLNNAEQIAPVVELQYFCQISDSEFIQCRGLVADYLAVYGNQQSKLPRLQLVWTVSRRTLNKLRPSTRCILDLEPIMEDETDSEGEDDDSGPFDSENDENDMQKAALVKMQLSSRCIEAVVSSLSKLTKGGPGGGGDDPATKCAHCPDMPSQLVLDHNHNATTKLPTICDNGPHGPKLRGICDKLSFKVHSDEDQFNSEQDAGVEQSLTADSP